MKTKRIAIMMLCLFMCVIMGGEILLSAFFIPTSAASQYSSPLEDLESAGNFDVSDYPDIPTDYSLQVIALAESVDGELYVYVYQPSAATKLLTATSITLDVPLNDDSRNFRIYSLTLLGTQGVFHKYRVNSLTLRETPMRKYSVSEIFRAFDSSIDVAPENDNTISEKAYPVGKMWTLRDSGSSVSTEVVYEDVIDVTEKHIGYVKYNKDSLVNDFLGYSHQIHSHYIAFSTDRPIDSISEIDVYFKTQSVDTYPEANAGLWTETIRGDKIDTYKTWTASDVLEINTSQFYPEHYKYKRIQSVAAFREMENKDITNESVLEGKEWILRFYETIWSDTLSTTGDQGGIGTYTGSAHHTEVTDVALLRIEYIYDGVVYNLGVVDDMQTGSKNPDGSHDYVEDEDWWQKIMMVLMLLVLLWALTFLSGPLGWFFKLLVWLLSRPWAIFRWLLGFLEKKQKVKPKTKGKTKGG